MALGPSTRNLVRNLDDVRQVLTGERLRHPPAPPAIAGAGNHADGIYWGMRKPTAALLSLLMAGSLALAPAACSDEEIDSDEEARRAYLGLDKSVSKSLTLGFAGFNAASSANISTQMANGYATGALAITGQVDQGSSANKGMRLHVGMVDFSDGPFAVDPEGKHKINITYATHPDPAMQPALHLSLRNIPTGTFSGTLTGTYQMTGAISGEAVLTLTFSGTLESDGTGGTQRGPGSTEVTGTVTDGEYRVDLTI
jgi:hypothetical protein